MLKSKFKDNLFFVSLLLHLVMLSAFIISFEWSSPNFVLENSDQNVMNAIIMDTSKIQMAKPIPQSAKKTAELTPKKLLPAKTPPKAQTEVKKPTPPVVHKNVIAISEKHQKIKKDLFEKELLADLKKAKVKKNKKHNDIEKEFAKELKAAQSANSIQQELMNEKNELASSQSQKMQGVIDKYKALILQAIGQHWLVPNGVDKSLSSELLIRVSPGGTVLDVEIVRSSGDDALDRSARAAVLKASPLPVPTASNEFAPFREFILKVKPENILARDNGLS